MTVPLTNEVFMPQSLPQHPCSADLPAAWLVTALSFAGFQV